MTTDPQSDPVERVARIIGAVPGSSIHSAIILTVDEYKAWLTEQGIPIDKLLSGETVAVPKPKVEIERSHLTRYLNTVDWREHIDQADQEAE